MGNFEFNYKKPEKKSKHFNFLLKPSINQKLDELVETGRIRSKGDLINSLLEEFINNLE